MIIDAHVHISTYTGKGNSLEECLRILLKEMEENGIGRAIIIPDNIENDPKIADIKTAINLIKGRDNLFLLGSPQITQKGSTELEYYQKLIIDGVIKGLKFFPGHDPYFPADERCLPYYELCQKLEVPVVFHTGENSNNSESAEYNDPKYIVEIAKKYSSLKIVITHYYWPRVDYCYEITKDIPNIYFETAALADEEVIEKTGLEKIKQVLKQTIQDKPDQVFFGTDWPMCDIAKHLELVKSIGLTKETEELVLYINAKNVYKI